MFDSKQHILAFDHNRLPACRLVPKATQKRTRNCPVSTAMWFLTHHGKQTTKSVPMRKAPDRNILEERNSGQCFHSYPFILFSKKNIFFSFRSQNSRRTLNSFLSCVPYFGASYCCFSCQFMPDSSSTLRTCVIQSMFPSLQTPELHTNNLRVSNVEDALFCNCVSFCTFGSSKTSLQADHLKF